MNGTLVLGISPKDDNYDTFKNFHFSILSQLPAGSKVQVVFARSTGKITLEKYFTPEELAKINSLNLDIEVFHTKKASGVWIQDYLPIPVRDADGQITYVEFEDGRKDLGRHSPFKSFAEAKGAKYEKSKMGLPVGAMATDGETVYISTLIRDKNYEFGDRHKVLAELKSKLKTEKIVFFSGLPGERTEHLDLYMKFWNKDTVLISDSIVPKEKKFLDEKAQYFKSIGKTVVRIPNAKNKLGPDAIYTSSKPHIPATLSYVNHQFINGKLYLPAYKPVDDAVAKRRFIKLGIKAEDIIFIRSEDLICEGGAVHCLTGRIP